MKYKCIRSYCSGEWLTKGNVYEDIDGKFTYDDGYVNQHWKKGLQLKYNVVLAH